MQLRWVSRGTAYATIDGRALRISGEALLEGDPDYLIYPQYLNQWEDGSPLPEEEKSRILADVVTEAAKLGLKFEVEQENAHERTPWKYRKTLCVSVHGLALLRDAPTLAATPRSRSEAPKALPP